MRKTSFVLLNLTLWVSESKSKIQLASESQHRSLRTCSRELPQHIQNRKNIQGTVKAVVSKLYKIVHRSITPAWAKPNSYLTEYLWPSWTRPLCCGCRWQSWSGDRASSSALSARSQTFPTDTFGLPATNGGRLGTWDNTSGYQSRGSQPFEREDRTCLKTIWSIFPGSLCCSRSCQKLFWLPPGDS